MRAANADTQAPVQMYDQVRVGVKPAGANFFGARSCPVRTTRRVYRKSKETFNIRQAEGLRQEETLHAFSQ
jgi:hypothetical protein